MSQDNLTWKYDRNRKLRSLENYKRQHAARHPDVLMARTLTEARRILFGEKRSMHGLHGKQLDSNGRSFWMGKGYNV